jgi:flagellin-specific chaperone FliS
MKNTLLKIALKIQLSILNFRIYLIITDLEIVLYDEDKEILSKKLDYLYSKAHNVITKIELL